MARGPIGKRSAAVQWLINRLKEVPVGSTITYQECSDAAGENICEERHILRSARYALMREEGIAFDVMPSIGLVRADAQGVFNLVDTQSKRTRRCARKGRLLSTCATPAELQVDQRESFIARQCYFALTESCGSARKIRKLETAIKPVQRELTMGEMLDALKGGNGPQKGTDS